MKLENTTFPNQFTIKFIYINLIWIITCGNCFSQDYSTDVVQKIYTIVDGLPSNEVHYIYEDDKNYLWFCTDEGLSRFDGIEFKNYDQNDGLPEVFVLKLKRLKSGKTIGWTLHGSIFYFDEGKVENISLSRNICERYDKCIITDIVDDQYGNLYVSHSDLNGYSKIDLEGNVEIIDSGDGDGLIYKTIKIDSQHFSYFKKDTNIKISQVFFPKKNTKLSIQVSRFGGSRPLEIDENLYQTIGDKLIITKDNLLNIVELPEPCWGLSLKDNSILLFSHFYGYFEYSIEDNKLIDKTKKDPQYSITNYYRDSRGTEWIATHSSGIIKISENKIKQIKADFLTGKHIHSSRKLIDGSTFVLADENEFKRASIWMLNPDLKVTKIDEDIEPRILFQEVKEEKNILYFGRIENVNSFAFKAFQYDSKYAKSFLRCLNNFNLENIKVTFSQKMVFRDSCLFTIQKNILTVYCNDQNSNQRLALDEKLDIRSISVSQKYIFLGTKNNGLFIVDIATQEVKKFGKELSSNHIKSITVQSEDTLFISTIEGVHRLVFTSNSYNLNGFVNNNIGLPVQEINDIQYFKDSLLITYPNAIYIIPVTAFDEMDRLSTKSFISDVNHSSTIGNADSPIIKYKDNYIRFLFSKLYFGNPLKEEIWYRLKGHKNEWARSASGYLEYISLPPENYTLEIATKDKSSDQFELCDQYNFEIETPFNLSKWMYLVYSILSLLVIIILVLLVRRYDRIKQERIFRLKSLRLKVLMSQLNPHFIFNVLNGIQSLIVDNNPVRASDKLADFSRLLRNTLEASDRPLITIKEDIELIKEYGNFEIHRKSGAIDIIYTIDKTVEGLFTPPMLIQPLIENSIRHGLKKVSGQKGKIEIIIERSENQIYYCVKDNGTGMKPKPKSEYGKGIQLVRERVKIINEKNNVDDNFTIDSSSEGTLTSFNLSQIKKTWT